MKNCPNCKIQVGPGFDQCPICQNELLTQETPASRDEKPFFPDDERKSSLEKRSFAFKLQMFIVLVACLVCVSLDFIFDFHGEAHWSVCVLLFGLCLEVVMTNFLKKSLHIVKLVNITVFMMAVAVFFIGYYLGLAMVEYKYVLPGILIFSMIGNSVAAMFEFDGNTMVYALVNILLIIVPWIIQYVWCGVPFLLWNIGFIMGLIILLAFLIFKGGKVVAEVQKRLNV